MTAQPNPIAPEPLASQLRAVLARHPQVNFAMLFGSLARGTARPDSDLDLAVGAGRPLHAD
ncbi:MAG: nucleotidyltransferase domain-containing protein, partial [Metallibacterium scheffleri]